MQLKQLLKYIGIKTDDNRPVQGIIDDSRIVSAGDIFICFKGAEKYCQQALDNGAIFILKETDYDNFTEIIDTLIDYFYNQIKIKLVAIIGTNGKSTTVSLLADMLNKLQLKAVSCGTLGFKAGNLNIDLANTTPSYISLRYLINKAEKLAATYFVFEVSSHALVLKRLQQIKVDYFIFTGIASDHLDFHHDFSSYLAAKAKIKEHIKNDTVAFINGDDQHYRSFIIDQTFLYGIKNCYIPIKKINYQLANTSFMIGKEQFNINIPGQYNLYNYLACFYFLSYLRCDIKKIQEISCHLALPEGRCQLVAKKPLVYIDFGHTEQAIKAVLEHFRLVSTQKIIAIVGCGGNRDQQKRIKIGQLCDELANYTIITSDNPRNEDPLSIAKMIAAGFKSSNYHIQIDRRLAIKEALQNEDQIIIIFGKGHEKKQIFSDHSVHFSDQEVVNESINQLYFNN